jgi:hypothetical protein
MAVVRAVEAYPKIIYSDIDKDVKQGADQNLLRCMKAFLANNGWDKFVRPQKFRYHVVEVADHVQSHPQDFAKLMFDNTELISVARLSASTG